jgi:hypothetical protein
VVLGANGILDLAATKALRATMTLPAPRTKKARKAPAP